MTWVGINGLSPARNALMVIINRCVDQGQPFYLSRAAKALERADSTVRTTLYLLRDSGKVQVECDTDHKGARYRLTLPDGRSTPWPREVSERPDTRPRGDDIVLRREEAEAARAAHRRFWLAQERAPRRRELPRNDNFMDKATVLALQGMAHG